MPSSLPPRPDLENLRRKAKQLHRQWQATDPGAIARLAAHAPDLPATLSTAQLVVARERGFRSWAALKAVVGQLSAGGVQYEAIGGAYAKWRRADPRIAAVILEALGTARTVVNVGAGAGSYEPIDRPVIPIEPSTTMARQRDPALPPAILGVAESLPLADDTADAAMAVLTVHHWADRRRGLAEMRRVARERVVLFVRDPAVAQWWWLYDYFPSTAQLVSSRETPLAAISQILGPLEVRAVPISADCQDGFEAAYWRRPEMFLEPEACAAMSALALISESDRDDGMRQLRADLASGAWNRRHAHLLELDQLDLGYRVVMANVKSHRAGQGLKQSG